MKCLAVFAVAVTPLWQIAQGAETLAWSMRAPAKVTVLLWQVSHGAAVGICLGGFAVAVTPLWQAMQLLMIPVWFIRAPAKLTVLL